MFAPLLINTLFNWQIFCHNLMLMRIGNHIFLFPSILYLLCPFHSLFSDLFLKAFFTSYNFVVFYPSYPHPNVFFLSFILGLFTMFLSTALLFCPVMFSLPLLKYLISNKYVPSAFTHSHSIRFQ